MHATSFKSTFSRALFWYTIGAFMVITFILNLYGSHHEQFSYLARSFLRGDTFLPDEFIADVAAGTTGFNDVVTFGSRYYWHLAPFPALMLAPFVFVSETFFNTSFRQGYLQFFLTLGVFFLARRLARHYGFSNKDAALLAFGFCFASVYLPIALMPSSWYFSHVVATLCVFGSLKEWYGKKCCWLIGFLLAFTLATRYLAALGVIFFILEIVADRSWSANQKLRMLTHLTVPIMASALLLLAYNAARFNDPFENGYRLANNNPSIPAIARFELLNYGIFQLKNIPTNFYYYFIKTLDPIVLSEEEAGKQTYILKPPYVQAGYPGAGFWATAPMFLYVFRVRPRSKDVKSSLIVIGVILVFLLMYYYPGWTQLGPRYLIDLLPFGYIVLLHAFPDRRLSRLAKTVIFGSALLNLCLHVTNGYFFYELAGARV